MGFLKKIKKAVSKVVKQAADPIKTVAGAIAGGENQQQQQEAPTPAAQVVAPPAPATQVETPNVSTEGDEDSASTESDLKKNRANGKKSLSVARSSGNGINL